MMIIDKIAIAVIIASMIFVLYLFYEMYKGIK